jgi:hypothetical protein
VNPADETLHVRADRENSARDWWLYDGRTGERLKAPTIRPVGQERAFDREGRLYLNDSAAQNAKGNLLLRFTAAGKPAPFSATGDQRAEPLPGFMKAGPRGFCVAPSGDVYVLHYPGDPWKPEGNRTTVTVVGPDGKVKREEVVRSLRTAASIRVDRAGNIYVAENVKGPDGSVPPELRIAPAPAGRVWGPRYDHSAWYPWIYGSIVKFGPEGGRIEPAERGEFHTGWPAWYPDKGAVAVTGAKWLRPGMAPVPAADQVCVCDAGRFDLDRFDRLYVPDVGRCRVTVLDSNGNVLTHFGGYGNMDSAGPGSAVPVPAIPFGWPACVAVSPEAVYVADWLNPRVLRVRPTYAVTATCAVR